MSCTARSDEMYRTLEFHAADRLPPAADVLPRGISLCGTYASAGSPAAIPSVSRPPAFLWLHPNHPSLLLLALAANWLHTRTALHCPTWRGVPHVMMMPPAVLSRVCELKDYTTICSSGPSEVLALIALRRCVC